MDCNNRAEQANDKEILLYFRKYSSQKTLPDTVQIATAVCYNFKMIIKNFSFSK